MNVFINFDPNNTLDLLNGKLNSRPRLHRFDDSIYLDASNKT